MVTRSAVKFLFKRESFSLIKKYSNYLSRGLFVRCDMIDVCNFFFTIKIIVPLSVTGLSPLATHVISQPSLGQHGLR